LQDPIVVFQYLQQEIALGTNSVEDLLRNLSLHENHVFTKEEFRILDTFTNKVRKQIFLAGPPSEALEKEMVKQKEKGKVEKYMPLRKATVHISPDYLLRQDRQETVSQLKHPVNGTLSQLLCTHKVHKQIPLTGPPMSMI
jgi:hypothetical protein